MRWTTSENIPYISYSNEQLNKLPKIKSGMSIECTKCGKDHILKAGKNIKTGEDDELLLFYACGENNYLGALDGRCITGVKPCTSGEM